ncbi:hypothetical protein PG988_006158 [Apiospora saccharicola]
MPSLPITSIDSWSTHAESDTSLKACEERANHYADEAETAASAVEQIARANFEVIPHATITQASARVARIAAGEGDDKQAKISAGRALEVSATLRLPPPHGKAPASVTNTLSSTVLSLSATSDGRDVPKTH